jgi:hypothetical protein
MGAKMSKFTKEVLTFQAGEDLLKYRRVKVESGTTTDPPEVVYADAGEQGVGVVDKDASDGEFVAVKVNTWGGSLEGYAADTFSRGATLYGAADGKISDTSSGSAIGIALGAATAAGDIIEWMPFNVLSTTAATVSYADAGGQTAAATVEAALAEVYTDILSAQNCIPLPLANFKETTNFDVGNIAANGGVLASDTTPILEAINAATDGCQRFAWAASNNDQVTVQAILPPDIDVTADIVFHCRIASESTTDAVGFTVDWFINEGDTKVVDTTTTNQTATYAEKTATLGNADIDAGSQTITIGLTPVAHTTDAMYMTAAWLEYTSVLKTS